MPDSGGQGEQPLGDAGADPGDSAPVVQFKVQLALPASPLKRVKWTKPRTLRAVDPAVVINSVQARRFLDAAGEQGPRGERLKAFFGCLYYAAMRPEEAIDLRRERT